VHRLRSRALDAVTGLIADLEKAGGLNAAGAQAEIARSLQARAQFYVDFIESENSTGFHAPEEAGRILAEAIDSARQGQIALRDRDFKP
jgi:nitrite reductase (cytochrome c-552)